LKEKNQKNFMQNFVLRGVKLVPGFKNLYSQAGNIGWARDFPARQGNFPQEYWMYCKKN